MGICKKIAVFLLLLSFIPLALAINTDYTKINKENENIKAKILNIKIKNKEFSEIKNKNNQILEKEVDSLSLLKTIKEIFNCSGIFADSYAILNQKEIECSFTCKDKQFIYFINKFYDNDFSLTFKNLFFECINDDICVKSVISSENSFQKKSFFLNNKLFYKEKIALEDKNLFSEKTFPVESELKKETSSKEENAFSVIGKISNEEGTFTYIKTIDGKIKKIKESK